MNHPFRNFVRWFIASGAISIGLSCSHPPKPTTPTVHQPASPAVASVSDASAWRNAPPLPGISGQFHYPSPVVRTLANGLRLYYVERTTGPVALSAVVSHGAGDDPPNKSGLSALTAELMVEATTQHHHLALSEAAEKLGSTLDGSANRDYIRLSMDTLAEDIDKGLELLAESLVHPAFLEADFRRLRNQMLDELRTERQNPTRIASLVGVRTILGPDFGNPVDGCPESVQRLSANDAVKWHAQWVTPRETAVFIVGPIPQERAITAVEKAFHNWNRTTPVRPVTADVSPVRPTERTVFLLDRPSSVQSAIFVVQFFPKRMHDGFIAREHLDNVLGGLFTSRINHNLREIHAYTYGARTSAIATRSFGLFTVTTSVSSEVTVPALREALSELAAIRGPVAATPINEAELARSSADLVQSLGAHLEEGHRVLGDLEQLFVYELPIDYFSHYPQAVRSVSLEEANQQAERLTPERLVIVIVGDASTLRGTLADAGFTVAQPTNACLDG